MTTSEEPLVSFGSAEAERLLRSGWGQGSIFRPNEHISGPQGIGDVFLVVCSQACVVVSPNLTRDPTIEVAVGQRLDKYSPKAQQATGEDARKFHMRAPGVGCAAIEVNINSRFTVDRAVLLNFRPEAQADEGAQRDFAGWIGRYYTRIALPNELVVRLSAGWFESFKRVLKARPAQGLGEDITTYQEAIQSAYIRWQPDRELDSSRSYELDLMLLCRDAAAVEALERELIGRGVDLENRTTSSGVASTCAVQSTSETFVSELDGWVRFTHWDYLSGLGEALGTDL